MASKKKEAIPQEDSDLLEASEDQEQLDEFTADNTGGDAGTSVKPAEVPEPASTGSSARSPDKSVGDPKTPPNPSAMVSKAHLMSQVISSMNKMRKETLQKVANDVASNYKGNKKVLGFNNY